MIRVLNVMGSLQCGGEETTTMNYYRNIDRSKIQFDFLITSNNKKDYYEDEAFSLGARVFRRPARKKIPFKNMLGLYKVLKDNPEIKIVHIHANKPVSAIDSLTALLCGIKVRIVHSRNALPLFALSQRLFQPLLRVTATHWLGCSTEAIIALFGLKQIKSYKTTVFKNARDLSRFRYDPNRRASTRKELDIDNRAVLLNVGNLRTQKNQIFLLEAFALACKKRPELVLLIAGEGDLRAELEGKVSALGVKDSVRLLGQRGDVPDLLQAADVFVFPSLYEGLGTVSIEAQAAGLTCLISDTITSECKVTDLVGFLPIDKGPALWANKMRECGSIERHDTLEDIRRAGYDITEAAKKLETLYLNVLKEKER